MLNKRGAVKWVVLGIVAIVVLVVLMIIIVSTPLWPKITSAASVSVDASATSFGTILGSSWAFFDFIFGQVPSFLVALTNTKWSPVIITVAMWLLLFVTFGDIIATFGTFNHSVAWLVAFLVAVIAANVKFVIYILAFSIGLFSILGGFAVIAGLVSAFVAFFAVNWGVKGLGPWLMRRKAFIQVEKTQIATEVGAKEVAGAIKGMKDIGEELAK